MVKVTWAILACLLFSQCVYSITPLPPPSKSGRWETEQAVSSCFYTSFLFGQFGCRNCTWRTASTSQHLWDVLFILSPPSALGETLERVLISAVICRIIHLALKTQDWLFFYLYFHLLCTTYKNTLRTLLKGLELLSAFNLFSPADPLGLISYLTLLLIAGKSFIIGEKYFLVVIFQNHYVYVIVQTILLIHFPSILNKV